MGDIIQKKLGRYERISILLVLLLCIFCLVVSYFHMDYMGDEREIRVEINQFLSWLQDNSKEREELPEIDFPYCVFDGMGQVLYTTMEEYSTGAKVDLSTLGGSRHYMVPIVCGEEVRGLLLVDPTAARKDILLESWRREIGMAGIFVAFFLVFQVRIQRVLKKDIWEPVREIHYSTKSILSGSYEAAIRYDYDGEIGTLCHDFEKMRGEIYNRVMREQQAAEKERVLYASISHDLKTPIAIITGYLEQILYGVVTSQEKIKEIVEHALTKAKVLNKLTADILEHSKAQMNQMSICRQEVYADVFFGALLAEYRQEALQRDYELTYAKPPGVLFSIDPDRIAQVMQNLVDNAVKYGGRNIRIEIGFDIIEQGNEGKLLIVSVKDNGRGIEAADLPFIFDLFYRGNKARTQSIPGSGIGLNLSKYIVEQHGGNIECDSIAGVGTTISFSLPVL